MIDEEVVANGEIIDGTMVFDSPSMFRRYLQERANIIFRRANNGRRTNNRRRTIRRVNVVIGGEMIGGAQIIDGILEFDSHSLFRLQCYQFTLLQRNQATMRRNTRNEEAAAIRRRNVSNEEVVAKGEMIDGAEDVKEEAESECSICLRVMRASESNSNATFCMPQPHPCSHVFHYNCIVKWLQIKNTCPLCRRIIHL